MSRIGAALHVLRGKPTLYRVTFKSPTNVEATDQLYIQNCTFDSEPWIGGKRYRMVDGRLVAEGDS